jgi:aminoglycoside phosphotransferase family enzyme/predicted kinase
MLVKFLQDPGLFDHPVERFEVIETHISWVLLTGPYAYKIKKPVNLGFLDFSTLKSRKFYCEEEIRLNRRLAPEIYLGVVPITGTEDHPSLKGGGPPIEYAVKMVEFPQGSRLDNLLKQGKLKPAYIDALAQTLADFHGRIECAGPESPFGTPEKIYQPVAENFEQMEELVAEKDGIEKLDGLRSWCGKEKTDLQDIFVKRKKNEFIRECHGDAYLANMVLWNDRVILFDCIEFNEHLRWIDVMSEAAFTTMDLEDRGVSHFANRFLNLYLELMGDYEGLKVLRFFKVYRALVRAKVAAIRMNQKGLKTDEKREIQKELHGYLNLAARYTAPASPTLMITHGLSGSGKTHGTGPVVESTGAIRIRTDIERKRMFGLKQEAKSTKELKKEMYHPETSRRVYDRLLDLCRIGLEAGYSMIADGTFLKREERLAFQRLAEELKVPFVILDFQAPEATLRERISRREAKGGDASEADLSVLEFQMKIQEPLGADEIAFAESISSTQY